MKRCASIAFAAALLLLCTGCATTRLTVTTPDGLRVDVRFPKNLAAQDLRLEVGGHKLTAKSLRTDASGVIDAKAGAVAAAGEAAAQIAPAVVGGLAP